MVEASSSANKLIFGTPNEGTVDENTVHVHPAQAKLLLKLLTPKSFAAIETASADGAPTKLPVTVNTDEDFWRCMFAALADNGTVQVRVVEGEGGRDSLQSLLKMHGFVDVQLSNPDYDNGVMVVFAKKAAFKQGGTSLKNRKKAAGAATSGDANPWAGLNEENADQINEDSLMQDENAVKAVTDTFAGDCDRIMPGKPCENCTCGKKELYEGKITTEQLETGQVESSCGKCYLGDAFRCAGCPFRGKPAFEAGDKVKLQNADTTSATNDAAIAPATQVKTTETGSSKVVLEL